MIGLYVSFMHFGGYVVAPGYTDPAKFEDGNPYGAGKVTGETTELEQVDLDAIDHLVERALTVGAKLAPSPELPHGVQDPRGLGVAGLRAGHPGRGVEHVLPDRRPGGLVGADHQGRGVRQRAA